MSGIVAERAVQEPLAESTGSTAASLWKLSVRVLGQPAGTGQEQTFAAAEKSTSKRTSNGHLKYGVAICADAAMSVYAARMAAE